MQTYPGSVFVRRAIALAFGVIGGPGTNAFAYAEKRWGARSDIVTSMQTKAMLPSAGTGAGDPMAEVLDSEQTEFIDLLKRVSMFDRTNGIRRMSPTAPFIPDAAVRPSGYWVGESGAIPATIMATRIGRLRRHKVASILVLPDELVQDQSQASEMFIRDLMVQAITWALDIAYLDPFNAGSASMPAAVTHDCPTFASSGDPADDVATLIANYSGSLERATFYAHPRLGAQIGLRAPNGVGAACGALGGTLAGLPLICGEASPFDSDGATLALVDAGAVAALDTGIRVSATKQATIEQADNPTGRGDTPVAVTGSNLISLYQSDMVGIKIVRDVSWERVSETSAVVVTGADYSAS